jgi:amphi-Trp domain-containing protein
MSDVEVSRTESLSRREAARRLAMLAEALADGGHVEVELGATRLKLHVPDEIRCEIEVEIDGEEIELELELKWSTAPVPVEHAAEGPAKTKPARHKSNSG